MKNSKKMTENQETFIFDFDSTFIKVEALDVLCEVIYQDSAAGVQILSEIQRLTDLGMEGKLSLKESLTKRIQLLQANTDHIGTVIEELKKKVTASVIRNRTFFKRIWFNHICLRHWVASWTRLFCFTQKNGISQ